MSSSKEETAERASLEGGPERDGARKALSGGGHRRGKGDPPDEIVPPIPPGAPRPTPMMMINDISKLFRYRMRKASEQAGIPEGYRWILFHLGRRESATQLELSKLTHTTPPTVSVTLRAMEADGYVTRTQDKGDMRVIHVSLTEKGLAVERENRRHAEETDRISLSGMSDEEKKTLESLLFRMRSNIIEASFPDKQRENDEREGPK